MDDPGAGGGGADTSETAARLGDRLSALLPFLLTMMADRSRNQSFRMALRLQMLFWLLGVVVDQLDATKGVVERARERLKDVDAALHQRSESGDGAEW